MVYVAYAVLAAGAVLWWSSRGEDLTAAESARAACNMLRSDYTDGLERAARFAAQAREDDPEAYTALDEAVYAARRTSGSLNATGFASAARAVQDVCDSIGRG